MKLRGLISGLAMLLSASAATAAELAAASDRAARAKEATEQRLA